MRYKSFGLKVSLLAILFFATLCLQSKAQILELNQELTFSVESKTFFPFSETANQEVKNFVKEGLPIDATFTIVSGSGIRIRPAADGVEFGESLSIPPPPNVGQSATIPLDFSASPQGAQFLGLKIAPISTPSTFKILVIPPKESTGLPTTPSSSGGIVITPTPPPNGSETSSGTPTSPITNKYNGVTIIRTLLNETTVSGFSKLTNNPQCKNTPKDINQDFSPSLLTSTIAELIINNLNNSLSNNVIVSRNDVFQNQRIFEKYKNDSNKTQFYLTGVFPSIVKDSSSEDLKIPCVNEVPPDSCDRLCQNEGACCGKDSEGFATHTCQMSVSQFRCKCQEGIVTATSSTPIKDLSSPPNIRYSIKSNKKWKISLSGNGFYDPSFEACIAPYCLVVENSMPVFFPNSACPILSLSNKRAIFSPIDPQNFAYSVTESSSFTQITGFDNYSLSIISGVDNKRGFFIFQPVPPLTTIFSTIDVTVDPTKLSDEAQPCDPIFECDLCGHPHITTIPEEDIPKTHCANCPSCGKCCLAGPDGEVWATCGLQSQRIGSRPCPCIPLNTSTRKFKCNN